MKTDLHNWDTIEDLMDHMRDTRYLEIHRNFTVSRDRLPYGEGSINLGIMESLTRGWYENRFWRETLFSNTKVPAMRELQSIARKMVRDHVRPCV